MDEVDLGRNSKYCFRINFWPERSQWPTDSKSLDDLTAELGQIIRLSGDVLYKLNREFVAETQDRTTPSFQPS